MVHILLLTSCIHLRPRRHLYHSGKHPPHKCQKVDPFPPLYKLNYSTTKHLQKFNPNRSALSRSPPSFAESPNSIFFFITVSLLQCRQNPSLHLYYFFHSQALPTLSRSVAESSTKYDCYHLTSLWYDMQCMLKLYSFTASYSPRC